jgi:peptide deformylase
VSKKRGAVQEVRIPIVQAFAMSPYDVRLYPDLALRVPASEVTEFDSSGETGVLADLVRGMGNTLLHKGGAALAAPQVGTARRVVVVRDQDNETKEVGAAYVLVNPRLTDVSEETWTAREGCMSLPGIEVEVERPLTVTVEAQDSYGEPMTIEETGWMARMFQHEIDHLDGKLTIDYLDDPAERRRVLTYYMVNAVARDLIPASPETKATLTSFLQA